MPLAFALNIHSHDHCATPQPSDQPEVRGMLTLEVQLTAPQADTHPWPSSLWPVASLVDRSVWLQFGPGLRDPSTWIFLPFPVPKKPHVSANFGNKVLLEHLKNQK